MFREKWTQAGLVTEETAAAMTIRDIKEFGGFFDNQLAGLLPPSIRVLRSHLKIPLMQELLHETPAG